MPSKGESDAYLRKLIGEYTVDTVLALATVVNKWENFRLHDQRYLSIVIIEEFIKSSSDKNAFEEFCLDLKIGTLKIIRTLYNDLLTEFLENDIIAKASIMETEFHMESWDVYNGLIFRLDKINKLLGESLYGKTNHT